MTDDQLARAIFCAVNDLDPVEGAPQIDAAFAGRPHCDGPWISARNARIAATAAREALTAPKAASEDGATGLRAVIADAVEFVSVADSEGFDPADALDLIREVAALAASPTDATGADAGGLGDSTG